MVQLSPTLRVAEKSWLPDCAGAFYYRTMNIERKVKEARRKNKAEAKRARRAARRQQKAAGPVKS
jgi:hypothetical protein